MIRTDILRGAIAEKGYSQKHVAKCIGISANSMSKKMKKGIFDSDEMCKMIELLEIKEPLSVFFAHDVAR